MFTSMFLINTFMPLIMINTPSHFYFSLNNFYGSLIMASSMILSMGFIMKLSMIIILVNIAILIISVVALRNQWYVNDTYFLRDMIPHHSMALLTSSAILERSNDSKIKELASGILKTQVNEINIMKQLL